tara:strand:+ start:303 stop:578 length:276 start_codon:yes stop_codon:yes gene_type:complete
VDLLTIAENKNNSSDPGDGVAIGAREMKNKIKALRESAGLSQREIGELMHVDRVTIAWWENGTTRASAANLHHLTVTVRLYQLQSELASIG